MPGRGVAHLLPLVLVGGFAAVLTAREGAGYEAVLRTHVAAALVQLLPGTVVWRVLRPRRGWLVEDLAFGAVVGAALSIPATVSGAILGAAWPVWVLPWAVAGVLLVVPSPRRRCLSARCEALPWWWGAGLAAVVLLALGDASDLFGQALPGTEPWTTAYVDIPYHLAISGEVAQHFPPHAPQVAGESLDYHWFMHAWLASTAGASGVDLDVLLTRTGPALLALVMPLVLGCTAMRVVATERLHAAVGLVSTVAATLLGPLPVGGSFLTGASRLVQPLSLTTTYVMAVGMVLLALLACRWRNLVGAGTWPAVLLLALAAGGAKGSWLPVLVAGVLVAAAVAALARHPMRKRVLLDLGLVGLALGVVLVALFRGSSGGMTWVPFTGLGVLALVRLLAPYAAALVVPFTSGRSDPVFWLLVGATGAGVGALLVFQHPGDSQHYFWFAAAPFAAMAATWGLAALLPDRLGSPARTRPVWTAASVALVVLAAAGAFPRVSTLSSAYDGLVLPAGPDVIGSVAQGQVGAARAIGRAAERDDLVMTNRHCRQRKPAPRCDHREFWVPAYSGQRMLVGGWAYTRRINEAYPESPSAAPFWDPELLELNDGFYTDPTRAKAQELYDLGVRWVYVDTRLPHEDLGGVADEVFRSPTALVYRLDPS